MADPNQTLRDALIAAGSPNLAGRVRAGLDDYIGGFQTLRDALMNSVTDPQEVGNTIAYATPGVGSALSARDAYEALGNRDWSGAALGAIGMVPVLGGIIAGPLAKTADHAMLAKASEMASAGRKAEDIWRDTGWFQGADGKWRFEIPDNESSFNRKGMTPKEYRILGNSLMADTGEAANVLTHPDLYAAYPSLNSLPFVQGRGNFKGQYSPPLRADDTGSIALNFDRATSGPDQHSTSLHEMQHAVQEAEGFSRGGNADALKGQYSNPSLSVYENAVRNDPQLKEYLALKGSPEYQRDVDTVNRVWNERFKNQYDQLDSQVTRANFKEMQPKLNALLAEADAAGRIEAPTLARTDELYALLRERGVPTQRPPEFLSGEEVYPRLAGETEARNVQARMNMTPEERRLTPPWTTQDVPNDQQIIRFR